MYTNFDLIYGEELYHHGVKGQKWGVRRYQNADGSLTAAGLRKYKSEAKKLARLEGYTDINKQASNVEKYEKRAGIAKKVGKTAAGIGIGTFAGALGSGAAELGLWNAYNKLNGIKNHRDELVRNATLNIMDLNRDVIFPLSETIPIIGGAVAVASAGYYAYNKIQSRLAKTRMTEVGHSKAVAKAKQQSDKMLEMFGDIKMSELSKKK